MSEGPCLSAVKTWIPKDEVYYVVLNNQWNQTFSNWKNDMMQTNETMVNWIQPIFVDCPESRKNHMFVVYELVLGAKNVFASSLC